jgi:hypothetical protein
VRTAFEPAANGHAPKDAEALCLQLVVHDSDVVAELAARAEGSERDTFALGALRIGVLALRQARGQVDADTVKNEGARLLLELQSRLDAHGADLRSSIEGQLCTYFDPTTGRFSERVERLVRRDGELEQLLRRQVGQDDSELARTLARNVGETSPLMKVLSADQSQGIVQSLAAATKAALEDQRTRVLGEFSLDRKDSALSRFIAELSAGNGQLSDNLRHHLNEVVSEFDLNREESALSRLVRRVDEAQQRISREFSLDDGSSALARMQHELMSVLESHRESTARFQEEVRTTLASIQARRSEALRATTHGSDFETAVVAFVDAEAQRLGDIAEATGNRVGLIKNCKVGDVVVQLGPEAAAAGARIVAEAKENASYDLKAASSELETARKNRGAAVGVFVFSKRTAPAGCEPIARYGEDIVIVWDAEDPATDLYLRCGISLARALCSRASVATHAREVDFNEIERAVRAVEKQASALSDIQTWAGTVQSSGIKIADKTRTMQVELDRQVKELDARLRDLRGATPE